MRKLFLISTFGLSVTSTAATDIDPFADNWYCVEAVIFSSTQAQSFEMDDDPFVEQIAVNDRRTYSRNLLPIQPDWVRPITNLFDYVTEETAGWWMTDAQARSSDTRTLWQFPSTKRSASPVGQDTSVTIDSLQSTDVVLDGFVATTGLNVGPPTVVRDSHESPLSQLHGWLASSSFIWHTEKLGFVSTATRLQRGGYRIIGHGMWLQPVPDRGAAIPLLLQLGERADSGLYEVEGTISATRGRYLHIDVQLWKNDLGPLIGERHSFIELRESRRMRSREVHYLDHPILGMLVKIVPADVTELAEEVSELSGRAPDDVEEVRGVPRNSEADLLMSDWSIATTCSGIYD